MMKRSTGVKRGAARHLLRQPHASLQRSAPQAGQAPTGRPPASAAKHDRDRRVSLRPIVRHVLAVSGEQFIAAHSREQNGRLLARLAANQISRDDGGIGRGLIHVPDQSRQQDRQHPARPRSLIFAPKMPRQPGGNFRIVERRFADAIFLRKRNRVGANRLVAWHAVIMATMLEESSPALRNAPIGTSLTICASTDRRKRSRTSSARSASDRV